MLSQQLCRFIFRRVSGGPNFRAMSGFFGTAYGFAVTLSLSLAAVAGIHYYTGCAAAWATPVVHLQVP